ncbi:hypothetical protein DFH09DRAFT_1281948 [Mycena vulgaris]|nr:hypothetical protein DFH09DRAFT_1281948 [Mycena vulgaris]
MSFSSLLSAAGPSATTLRALSEYCASCDSPASESFAHSDSTYSVIHLTPPVSLQKSDPDIPHIILESDRFQSASVQEKMLKALKPSTGSGFTRTAPSQRDRADRLASTQGLPPSVSDSYFDDVSPFDASPPVRMGLGLLIPTGSTNELRPLCPLASRQTSPTRGFGFDTPMNCLSPELLSPSPVVRTGSSAGYAGLGHGLPSHMSPTSPRLASGFTITSPRSISQLYGTVPSPGSIPYGLLSRMSSLTRASQIEQQAKFLSRLKASPSLRPRPVVQGRGTRILKRAWVTLVRLVSSKYRGRKAIPGTVVVNPRLQRRSTSVVVSVSVCSGVL